MIGKRKPYRSSAFLSYCHEEMRPEPCCLCGERPWDQLHHFGDDGGQGMKPSDNEVARVCYECHPKFDLKRRGLLKSGYHEVLMAFEKDALALNRAYIEFLEDKKLGTLPASRCQACDHACHGGGCDARYIHVEPPADCALDELNLWLATEGPGLGPDEQRDWLLKWANRRAANVIGFFEETMREIATGGAPESAAFVARRALMMACLEGVDYGQDEDRMVRRDG